MQIVRIVQIVHHLAEHLTTVGKYEGVPSNNKDLPVNCIPTKLAFASPCHAKQAVPINGMHFKVCQAMASQPQSTSQWHANQGLPVNQWHSNKDLPSNARHAKQESASQSQTTKLYQVCQTRSASQWHAIQGLPVNSIAYQPRSASERQTNHALLKNSMATKVCWQMACLPRSAITWHTKKGLPANGMPSKV